MPCSRKIIDQIKVIGRIEDFEANNGTIFEDGVLQFGGNPLLHDTIIGGNFKLEFGPPADYLNTFIVRTRAVQYFETYNGAIYSTLSLYPNGVNISNSASSFGLMGAHDYSPNYADGRVYVQKIYTDNNIAGRPATTDVTIPGAPQNGQQITWNNSMGKWTMQTGGGAATAGADTQVIHNIGGVLVGNTSFTFNPANPSMAVPHIELGHTGFGGTQRVIIARTSAAYADIIIEPQGAGSVISYTTTGALIMGSPASSSLYQRLQARGSQPQVDIALEPKGPDGMVFIGDKDETGLYKRLAARGYNADIHLMLQSKGEGNVILDADPTASGDGGIVKIGHGSSFAPGVRTRKIYASSDFVTTNLHIGGDGENFTLSIGSPDQAHSNRYLSVSSSLADCNLNIFGKGQGLVAINGFVRSKKIAIVNWNMNNTGGVSIAHGFGINDWSKIISVEAVIRNDFGGDVGPLGRIVAAGVVEGGVAFWDNAAVYINRRVGGIFQSTIYDSTGGYVRGWIYINYEL